jgi:hypothetical protein
MQARQNDSASLGRWWLPLKLAMLSDQLELFVQAAATALVQLSVLI